MQTIVVEIKVSVSYPLLVEDIKQAIEDMYNPMGMSSHTVAVEVRKVDNEDNVR